MSGRPPDAERSVVELPDGTLPDARAIEAAFPPPGEDEPPGLRQAIADELADHLACVAAWEAAGGRSPAETAARVLRRFGDPRRLAVRLFLDATKGRRVMQRFTLGLTAATLALVGIVFWQSTSANAELAAALRALDEGVRNPSPADVFSDVSVRVVSEDGSPLEGFRVQLVTDSLGQFVCSGVSDAEGEAVSRRMPGGVIKLDASHPFGWTARTTQYLVEPGRALAIDLVAPDPAATATVRLVNRMSLEGWDAGQFVESVVSGAADAISVPEPAEVGIRVDAGAARTLTSGGADVQWTWRAGDAASTPRLVLTSGGGGAEVTTSLPTRRKRSSQKLLPEVYAQGELMSSVPWYEDGPTTLTIPAGDVLVTASAPAAKFEQVYESDNALWFKDVRNVPTLDGWQPATFGSIGFPRWSADVASAKQISVEDGEEVTLPVGFGTAKGE